MHTHPLPRWRCSHNNPIACDCNGRMEDREEHLRAEAYARLSDIEATREMLDKGARPISIDDAEGLAERDVLDNLSSHNLTWRDAVSAYSWLTKNMWGSGPEPTDEDVRKHLRMAREAVFMWSPDLPKGLVLLLAETLEELVAPDGVGGEAA